MNINITDLKEIDKKLRKMVTDNMGLTETDFFHHICLAVNEVGWLIRSIEKGKQPVQL